MQLALKSKSHLILQIKSLITILIFMIGTLRHQMPTQQVRYAPEKEKAKLPTHSRIQGMQTGKAIGHSSPFLSVE